MNRNRVLETDCRLDVKPPAERLDLTQVVARTDYAQPHVIKPAAQQRHRFDRRDQPEPARYRAVAHHRKRTIAGNRMRALGAAVGLEDARVGTIGYHHDLLPRNSRLPQPPALPALNPHPPP